MPFGIKGAVEVVCGICLEGREEKVWKKQKAERLALRPDLNLGLAAFPATLQSGGQGWAADGEGSRSSSFRKDLS